EPPATDGPQRQAVGEARVAPPVMDPERRSRGAVDRRGAVRPGDALLPLRAGVEQPELESRVEGARPRDKRAPPLRLVGRELRPPDERLRAELELARVRLGRVRRLIRPPARPVVAGARPRLDDLAADLRGEVHVRPARVPARCGPSELLSRDDVLP